MNFLFPYVGAEWSHAPNTMRIIARAHGSHPTFQLTLRREVGETCNAMHRRAQVEARKLFYRTQGVQNVVIHCHYEDTAGNVLFDDERQNTLSALREAIHDKDATVALSAIRALNRMQGLVPAGA